MTALSVCGVSHSYPVAGASRWWRTPPRQPVLDGLSFAVPQGTLTAIIGASGCGKSTLLRIIAGLITPAAGQVWSGERRVDGVPGNAAYHPQRDALLPWLTVQDNATLGAETCGRARAVARPQARKMLQRFGLDGYAAAYPDELSGGMRQRVALLRTFLTPLPVLALDEPFGALDALTRRSLQQWLMELTAHEQRPTVLITHDIEEALLLGDQVLVLSERPAKLVHVEPRPDAQARLRAFADGTDRQLAQQLFALLDAAPAV